MPISHAPQALDALDAARALHRIAPRCPVLLAANSTIEISVDVLARRRELSKSCADL
jgi:hypothetical protein